MVKCNKVHKRSPQDRVQSTRLISLAPIFHHSSNSTRTIQANTNNQVNPIMALFHLMVTEQALDMGTNLEKSVDQCIVAIHQVPTLPLGLVGNTFGQACQASASFTHYTQVADYVHSGQRS